jgi:hypothetical protein
MVRNTHHDHAPGSILPYTVYTVVCGERFRLCPTKKVHFRPFLAVSTTQQARAMKLEYEPDSY